MAQQQTISSCPKCGSTIVLTEIPGLCPQCALAGALAMDSSDEAARSLSLRDIPPPKQQTSCIGDYELLEVIAQGGMGVVYKARQRSLNRIVALKLLLGGGHAAQEFKKRFRQEAETVAKLKHSNIVPVYDVGEHDRQPYFSMEYVAGKDFSQLARTQPLSARSAANYVRIVSEAMAYAHQQGVLHRDLKPSNILLGMDDRPRITDFGLARQLDADSSLTTSGALLGTPGYLPPEQVSLRRGQVGVQSDVYALGAVLYYLLTGRPPFQAGSLGDTLQEVLNREPQSPRQLNPKVSRDLDTICLKCLRKEAAQRYATAQDLADDLGRFLQDEPIHAREVATYERLIKLCRRRPALVGLSAAMVLVIAVAGWNWKRLGGLVSDARLDAAQQAAAGRFAGEEAKRERVKRNQLQEFARLKQQEAELSLRKVEEANKQPSDKSSRAQQTINAGVITSGLSPGQAEGGAQSRREPHVSTIEESKKIQTTPATFQNDNGITSAPHIPKWPGNLPIKPEQVLPWTNSMSSTPVGFGGPIKFRKVNKSDPLPFPLPDPKVLAVQIGKHLRPGEDPRLLFNELSFAQNAYYLSILSNLNASGQSSSLGLEEQSSNEAVLDSSSASEQKLQLAAPNKEPLTSENLASTNSTETNKVEAKTGRGVVTRVSDNLIWVSLGADDGLAKGDKVKIYLPRGTPPTNYIEVAEIRLGIVNQNESMGASAKPMNVGWLVVRPGVEIK